MMEGSMSTEQELLQKICDDPTDIETRLVYADCLSERGDPRGAFIAHHCELERMTGLEDNYAELAATTRRLEAAHAPTWLADFLERADVKSTVYARTKLDSLFNAEFRHGFLYRIAMTPGDIASHWDWLREREPLQGVELRVGEHLPAEYHGLTQPSAFRTLKVSPDGWFTSNSVGDVLRWGPFEHLRELDLSLCDIGLAGVQLLTNVETDLPRHFEGWTPPPPLPEGQLERLVLHGTKLNDEPARLLFDAATTRALEQLVISQCQLTERATLEALAASPLSRLKHLSIAGNKALGGQLDALAGWPVLTQLKSLAVPQSATPDDLRALFPEPSAALRALDLSSAKALCAEPQTVAGAAASLTRLDIGTSRIGDVHWATLLKQGSVARLHELLANGCSLSDRGVEVLVASPLDRLLTLDLSSNKLTDKGLKALAGWPGLKHVTFLRVGNNRKVKAPGYQALADSPHFTPTVLAVGKAVDEETTAMLRERFGDALRVGG
jgi:uncharacterized protein (TIGR02996 family)